jgi:hypothetical protein
MSRLFDLKKASPPPTGPGKKRLLDALAAAELDDNARRLGEVLGAATAVTAVHYRCERHGRWMVEHGRAGDDYVFQLHPLKMITRPWQDVITSCIAAMDSIFPRSVQIHYRRPDEQWQVKFFTIRVAGVCRLPGWEAAMAKAITALAATGRD